jgi:iron complex transport system substrate-binding protein
VANSPGGRRLAAAVVAAAVSLAGLAACGSTSGGSAAAAADARGCVTKFDPNTDYFPVKSTFQDATNVTISYHRSYEVLTVKEPYPGGKPASYVLVRCGAPSPALTGDLAKAPHIQVPVTSIYSGSTTHLPLLAELGRLGSLTGVADGSYVVNADVRAAIAAGKVTTYAPGEQVNVEKVVTAKPDVLITDGTELSAYASLRAAGIPVLGFADWLEATPLGRAEWVKVMAALTGTESQAATVYSQIRSSYLALAKKATAAGVAKVQVLSGSMYQGTWYIPSGTSYVGRLLADAGATYPWATASPTGTGTGGASLDLSFEEVYAKDGVAPVWLTDGLWDAKADALKDDPRYATLAAMTTGQVWDENAIVGPGGGTDYFERGVERPDLVLADLVAILHPSLEPGHRFVFYKKLS